MFSANENIELRKYKRQVVEYVEETIPEDILDMGVNVMAMQVSCKAPGCVPLETAIVIVFPSSETELLKGLPESAGRSYKAKVLKPMTAVTKDDILDALPPEFIGGRRSFSRLCLQARDVMLGQITQLFGDDDLAGRGLLAEYLQKSLQDYIDRDCEPPEWGEDFPSTAKTSPPAESAMDVAPLGAGNIILKRPKDDQEEVKEKPVTSKPDSSSLQTKNNIPVGTVTQRKHQQAATQRLQQQLGGSSNLLAQLSAREHAPGIRRPGCPCCDPEHPSNVVDSLMQL